MMAIRGVGIFFKEGVLFDFLLDDVRQFEGREL
jgi:hypothetical protein